MMNLPQWSVVYDALRTFRQQRHQYPEVAMEEFETAKAVKAFADSIGYDRVRTIAKPGMVFSIVPDGFEAPEKAGLMFRAELDGLPIADKATHGYTSKIKGKGHLCGHDGHMSILLGLMKYTQALKQQGYLKEPVHFLFQPAEENGMGAQAMISDAAFDLKPRAIYALHNIPGAAKGSLWIKEGVFTPEVISVDFVVEGATSHAAQPHLGKNPAPVVAELIRLMEGLHRYDNQSTVSTFKEGDVIVAPVQIQMGQPDYGISAGNALVGYTFRTYLPEHLQAVKKAIQDSVESLQKKYGLPIQISWHQYFAANINDAKTTERLLTSVKQVGLSINLLQSPFEWGEDFGTFSQHIPACMFGLGAGEDCMPLHNQTYDFPDEIMKEGIMAFLSVLCTANHLDASTIKPWFQDD